MQTAKVVALDLGLFSNWLNKSAVQKSMSENESVAHVAITVYSFTFKFKLTEW